MAHVRRHGLALAYEQDGSGGPPVVLIHGWGTDRGVLRPLFEHLRDQRRVVAVDLRGHGDSDVPDPPYSIDELADDVAFIAEQLGLESPVVVGHSLGGVVAFDFASRHPVSAAVILESPVAAPPSMRAGAEAVLEPLRSERYLEVVGGFMRVMTGPHFDPAMGERLVAGAKAIPQQVLLSSLEGLWAYDSEAAAPAVTCPLLYVGTGEPYADVARLRALCPQLQTGELVGCGHYFPLEVPDQVNAMVSRFLDLTAGA